MSRAQRSRPDPDTARPRITFAMPSITLLSQALLSGLLAGGLYGLLGLGLSLSWELLRLVNSAHFALAFLGAYITYQFGSVLHLSLVVSLMVILPSFFLFGVAL